jgi:hypothetical protein
MAGLLSSPTTFLESLVASRYPHARVEMLPYGSTAHSANRYRVSFEVDVSQISREERARKILSMCEPQRRRKCRLHWGRKH